MDTELATIFNGPASEGTCSGPPIACFSGQLPEDLTDSPISSMTVINDSTVYITKPIGGLGTSGQFAYNSSWHSVINDENAGIPNFFTWLDAYNPNPSVPGTVRQGFAGTTGSLSPYLASSNRDFYIIGNIYDSLSAENPLNHGQILDWMAVSSQQVPNSQLTYPPPPGTVASFRFALRNDMFFQDGRKVTAFDVAFSYLSLRATGSVQGTYDASSMTGITVLSPSQFDISVNATTALTFPRLTSLSIIPGRYWTNAGRSTWDSSTATCAVANSLCYPAQYALTTNGGSTSVACSLTCVFPGSNMNADPLKISAVYDPVANSILIGSGPWQCGFGSTLGSGCSSTGSQNPPVGGAYTLTRFGKGIFPGASLSNAYFRSSGTLALCIWASGSSSGANCNGDFTRGFLAVSIVAACYGRPVGTPGCVHWQMGIGNPNGNGVTCCIVGISQIGIMSRFVGIGWITPYVWGGPTTGIGSFPPVLYEGSVTLNPSSIVGCNGAFPTGGYDC